MFSPDSRLLYDPRVTCSHLICRPFSPVRLSTRNVNISALTAHKLQPLNSTPPQLVGNTCIWRMLLLCPCTCARRVLSWREHNTLCLRLFVSRAAEKSSACLPKSLHICLFGCQYAGWILALFCVFVRESRAKRSFLWSGWRSGSLSDKI